jgi:hypothetical protein
MLSSFSSRHRAATLALALAATPALHAQTAVPSFTVSNSVELATLLKAVSTDTLILLNPGVYDDLALRDVKTGRNVTIRSRYAANRATLGRVSVRSSSRIRFDQVNFHGPRLPTEGYTVSTVTVRESDMIHFTNCNFWGSLNNDTNDDGILLRFMASTNSVVLNNVFREAKVAITSGDSTYMHWIGNNISNVREGINLYATQAITIDRNLFTGVFPNTAAGDHSDAIQIFTGMATRPTRSVTLSNNAMLFWNTVSQGIFIRNESGNAALDPAAITINNNLYYGQVRQAISANNVQGATLRSNTVLPAPGMVYVPALLANGSSSVVMDRNITPLIISNVAYTSTRNTMVATSKSTGVDIAAQFIGAVNIASPKIANFTVAAGSTAALNGSGFVPVTDIGGMSLASATTRYAAVQTKLHPRDGLGIFPTM